MIPFIQRINEGTAHIFTNGLITFIIVSLLILLLTAILYKITRKLLMKKFGENVIFFLRIIKAGYYIIAGYSIILMIVPLSETATTILASSGVLVLVLGFAAQEAVANIVGGFFITFFKPFSIGDLIVVVEVNLTGFVEDISLRHTTIRTFTNTLIVVPNSTINKSILENLSLTGAKKGNYLEIGIAYDSNIEEAMKIIQEIIEEHPSFIDNRREEELHQPTVVVRCTAFQDSSILLRTLFHTEDAAKGLAMASDCRILIKKRFDQAGIEIPFQQSVITIKKT